MGIEGHPLKKAFWQPEGPHLLPDNDATQFQVDDEIPGSNPHAWLYDGLLVRRAEPYRVRGQSRSVLGMELIAASKLGSPEGAEDDYCAGKDDH
jgi:hypothetical protein